MDPLVQRAFEEDSRREEEDLAKERYEAQKAERTEEIKLDCLRCGEKETREGYSLTEALIEEIEIVAPELAHLMSATSEELREIRFVSAFEQVKKALNCYAERMAEKELENDPNEDAIIEAAAEAKRLQAVMP